ncbi:MAG: hypothetical protein LAT64_13850 [Phycisphaerales bacterium]|nr:hypothetical protein [Planctomycetota bacterium]MCH8509834.1 hypothetical protein [Phycisphaerales bacterium]
MAEPPTIPKAACWLAPEQAEAIARVLSGAGIQPAFAGSPEPTHTGQVARALGCEACDDLRSAMTSLEVDLVFIASAGEFGHRDVDQDLTALQLAKQRAVPVATIDPIPAAAMELGGTRWIEALHNGTLAELIRVVPRTRRTGALDELHATLETFGVPRSCSARMTGPATLGSLGARLFDAMDMIRTLMGVPETIDACTVSPAKGRALHQVPGESLRGLAGDMTVHLRFADGRAAVVHLSDQSPTGGFDLRILGTEGLISLTPDRLAWQHPTGQLDETAIETEGDDPNEAAMTRQLSNLCAGVGPSHAPIDYPAVLAMAHAALLSCRTGQGEAPDTIRRLMRTA